MSVDDFERLKLDFMDDSHITFDEFIILKEHECEELINLIKLKADKAKLRKLWKQNNYNFNCGISNVSRNGSNNKISSCNDINYNNNQDNNNDDVDFNNHNISGGNIFDYLIQFISNILPPPPPQLSSVSSVPLELTSSSSSLFPPEQSSQALSSSTTSQHVSYESDTILVSSEIMSEFNTTATTNDNYDNNTDDIVKDNEECNAGKVTHIYHVYIYILVVVVYRYYHT